MLGEAKGPSSPAVSNHGALKMLAGEQKIARMQQYFP